MEINNAYEFIGLNLARITADQANSLLPGIEKEFKLLIKMINRLSSRELLSPFARNILKRFRHAIPNLSRRMKNFPQKTHESSDLSVFLKIIRRKLIFYWFCLAIIEHETNWESPSQAFSLFPAKGYNNIGGIYRRYSLAGGAPLNFAEFKGQRIFFNGDNAVFSTLKALLWPYYGKKSVFFIIDNRLKKLAKNSIRLFEMKFNWKSKYTSNASYSNILETSIAEKRTDTHLFFICHKDVFFSDIPGKILKQMKHIVTIDSIEHFKACKKKLLRNESCIYFSRKIYREKVAIVFPDRRYFDSFIFFQQRGGSLNEWSLKFFSFLYDDNRFLQMYNHEYLSPVWNIRQKSLDDDETVS